MPAVTFYGRRAFDATTTRYDFLPFQFMPFDDKMLVVNEVGEYLLLDAPVFAAFTSKTLVKTHEAYGDLKAHQFLYEDDPDFAVRLLAIKYRTKRDFLRDFTKLHIFVVSLRCDHSCHYCQVSRVSPDRHRFDMSAETAERALDLVFRSPADVLKIEFQGGEPLLNFERIRETVLSAERRAVQLAKTVEFVITSNLAFLDDDMLAFCGEHSILISTSLD